MGSSRIRICELWARSLATSTRCCSPTDIRSVAVAGSMWSRPTAPRKGTARWARVCRVAKTGTWSPARKMFSATLMVGTRLSSCGATAMPARFAWVGPVKRTGRPFSRYSPVKPVIEAADDPDKGRFSGTVLADQPHNLPGTDFEVRVLQCLDDTEVPANRGQFKQERASKNQPSGRFSVIPPQPPQAPEQSSSMP